MGILDRFFRKKQSDTSKIKATSSHQPDSKASSFSPQAAQKSDLNISTFFVPEAIWPDYVPDRLKRTFVVMGTDDSESIPCLQGDYAKTVFLMMYAKGAISVSKQAPQYLLYECGIKNPVSYRNSVADAGLLVEPDFTAILYGMKLSDIKAICRSLGISQSGVKTDVITRILSEADFSDLPNYLPTEKAYMLSEKGKIFLQEHEGYQILHRHPNWSISWKEYDQQHKDSESPYKTMLRIVQACLDKEKFNYLRNDYHTLSEIYKLSGNIAKSTEMLLYVQYLDLSGMCFYDSIQLFQQLYRNERVKFKKETLLTVENYVHSTFAPGIIDLIAKQKASITPDLIQLISTWWLPINACSPSDFRRIISEICDGILDEKKEQSILKANFIKAIE